MKVQITSNKNLRDESGRKIRLRVGDIYEGQHAQELLKNGAATIFQVPAEKRETKVVKPKETKAEGKINHATGAVEIVSKKSAKKAAKKPAKK